MSKVLTIRIDHETLGKADARAARLGVDRATYVRTLIAQDLGSDTEATSGSFSSEDLAGMYDGDGAPATNEQVRRRMSGRSRAAK